MYNIILYNLHDEQKIVWLKKTKKKKTYRTFMEISVFTNVSVCEKKSKPKKKDIFLYKVHFCNALARYALKMGIFVSFSCKCLISV